MRLKNRGLNSHTFSLTFRTSMGSHPDEKPSTGCCLPSNLCCPCPSSFPPLPPLGLPSFRSTLASQPRGILGLSFLGTPLNLTVFRLRKEKMGSQSTATVTEAFLRELVARRGASLWPDRLGTTPRPSSVRTSFRPQCTCKRSLWVVGVLCVGHGVGAV
jgi:hypothetical protein